MSSKILKLSTNDNVLIALEDLHPGNTVSWDNEEYTLFEAIPQKHKFACRDFEEGDTILMYGVPVGKATQSIQKGSLLTQGNIKHYAKEYSSSAERSSNWCPPDTSKFQDRTFQGYHRSNGEVGTTNNWIFIPLVFCENRNIETIKELLIEKLGYSTGRSYDLDVDHLIKLYKSGASSESLQASNILQAEETRISNRVFQNIDGIKFLSHEGGCGSDVQDVDTLRDLLAAYITHPNVAGATILSLGCQKLQIEQLKKAVASLDSTFDRPLIFLEQQSGLSEPQFIAEAVKQTFAGMAEANTNARQPAPLTKLKVGLECGGSDGFSGLSANPAVGHLSDLVASIGGTTILAEFPELCGVEQELCDRCVDDDLAKRFEKLMRTYHSQAESIGSNLSDNPSPGNIKDGLITDAIKSAGAAKKGGTSPITGVLGYTEIARKPGLNLLCTPGSDVESTTGLAGSWANIILFTTGLGTPTGNAVAPTIKISSNTTLAKKLSDIIDVDTGGIITGDATIESKGEEILEYVIQVASGEEIPNAVRLGQNDFIPWKRGISL